MSTVSEVRLTRDLRRLQEEPPAGISGGPVDDDIWSAVVCGPRGSHWVGDEYTDKPPQLQFISRMFHPNVYGDGGICLELLRSQWDRAYDVVGILISIQVLLSNPYPLSPANCKAAQLFCENKAEYKRKVLEIVAQSRKED